MTKTFDSWGEANDSEPGGAEAALRQRERELSQLVDMVPSHLWRLSPDGEPLFFNRRMVEFLGLEVADLDQPGKTRLQALLESIHPDDAAKFDEALSSSIESGRPFSMRYRLRRHDGVHRWMSSRAEALRDEAGRIVQWHGLCQDIDDQTHAEEAVRTLRERERELQLLIDMVPVYIGRTAPNGEPTFFSKRTATSIGLEYLGAWDKPGMNRLATMIAGAVHPEDGPRLQKKLMEALVRGEAYSIRYRQRDRNGVYRWMEGRADPLRDESGAIVQWYHVAIDIEDQVQTQDALRRSSDKLANAVRAASLAELSAAIAHEVNQPLAAIVTNSQACRRWLSAEPPNLERAKVTAEHITRDANSAADVVSRIRSLFRRKPEARLAEDINRLVGEVCELMADEIAAKSVRVEANLEANLPPVAVDRVQVQQLLVNLIRNGIEAMDGLVDRARLLQIGSRRHDGDAIRVEVRDSGTGFQDVQSVLEPFFTTKANGMGMGLAICRSIAEAHGGRLSISNHETGGAVVAFTLGSPAVEAE